MVDTEAERYFRGERFGRDPYLLGGFEMPKHDFWVTIHGERGEEWQGVLGTNRLPVQSPVPIWAELPGLGKALVFLVALNQLDAGQQEKIVAHLCGKFHLSQTDLEAEIREAGIPILASDCSIMVWNPQRWLS